MTHRNVSRSFSVITGHTAPADESDVTALHSDIKNSAAMDGTCVYLMGLTHLKEIADTLMQEGKPADTPAAVISGGFDGSYRAVYGTLREDCKGRNRVTCSYCYRRCGWFSGKIEIKSK